jgi:hypothetical protein
MRTSKLGLPFLAALILQLGSLHGQLGTASPAASPSPQLPDKESLLVTHIWQSTPIVEKALNDAAEAEAESEAKRQAEIMGFGPEDAIYWYVPPAPIQFAPDRHPNIIALKYRENRIWAELRFGRGNDLQGAICSIDPTTFQTDTVFFSPRPDPSWLADVKGRFDVVDGDIYVGVGDHIEKYDKITKQWESLGTNVPCDEIEAIGGRLYLTSRKSIIEYDVKNHASTVLASPQRVPAQNILDGLPLYTTPHVFPGPGDSLRVTAGSYVFQYDRAKRNWVRLGPQPAVWSTSQGVAVSTWKDGTVHYDPSTAFNRIVALGLGSESEQTLIEERSPYQLSPPRDGLWQRPADFPVGGSGATNGGKKGITYDGKTMDIFLGPIFRDQELRPNIGISGMRRFQHGNMVLYHFTEPGKPAAEIPLWLTFGSYAQHPEKIPSLSPPPWEFLTLLVPGGTVFTEKLRGDFWFIPDADIQKYVNEHQSGSASLETNHEPPIE